MLSFIYSLLKCCSIKFINCTRQSLDIVLVFFGYGMYPGLFIVEDTFLKVHYSALNKSFSEKTESIYIPHVGGKWGDGIVAIVH